MDQKKQIIQYCQQLRMPGITSRLDTLIANAEKQACGYVEFTLSLLKAEADLRQENDVKRRRKAASLPRTCDLNRYDHTFENGISKARINQLRELNWLEQGFNIMLLGPSGTGKTYLAGRSEEHTSE